MKFIKRLAAAVRRAFLREKRMPRIDAMIDEIDAALARNIARGKGPTAKVLAAGYGAGAPRA